MHLTAKYELHLRRNAVAIADLEKHLVDAGSLRKALNVVLSVRSQDKHCQLKPESAEKECIFKNTGEVCRITLSSGTGGDAFPQIMEVVAARLQE